MSLMQQHSTQDIDLKTICWDFISVSALVTHLSAGTNFLATVEFGEMVHNDGSCWSLTQKIVFKRFGSTRDRVRTRGFTNWVRVSLISAVMLNDSNFSHEFEMNSYLHNHCCGNCHEQ